MDGCGCRLVDVIGLIVVVFWFVVYGVWVLVALPLGGGLYVCSCGLRVVWFALLFISFAML